MSVCVPKYVSECARVLMCVWVGGGLENNLGFSPQELFTWSFQTVSNLVGSSLNSLGWLARKLQRSTPLSLPKDGITSACYHAQNFKVGSGDQRTQVLILTRSMFH